MKIRDTQIDVGARVRIKELSGEDALLSGRYGHACPPFAFAESGPGWVGVILDHSSDIRFGKCNVKETELEVIVYQTDHGEDSSNYTYAEVLSLAKGNKRYADLLITRASWQHIETLIEEDLREGEIREVGNTYLLTGGDLDGNFWVDLPTEECVDNSDGAWKNIATFKTREEAIAFAKEHFGADEEGRVSLVSG